MIHILCTGGNKRKNSNGKTFLDRFSCLLCRCSSLFMASTLPFALIQYFRQHQNFAKPLQRIPVSSSPSISKYPSKYVSAKAVSPYRGGPHDAIKEEIIETLTSESSKNSQSAPSSLKLVLVVGGSGGVGKDQQLFLHCSTCHLPLKTY